jgi:hypothetical protein
MFFSFRSVLVVLVLLVVLLSSAAYVGNAVGQYTAEYMADVMEGLQR